MLIRLGKIFRKTFRSTYLVRSGKVPEIGAPVFLRSGKLVGKVLDVFGPVNLPYIEIKPKQASKDLLGEVVYTNRLMKNIDKLRI
jgi:rRNA processing protein Gar1